MERFHYLVPLDARQETERISPTAIVDIDGWETMDIGSSLWMQNIDHIAQQMEERLSLEGTVVAQRANELQTEAQKVCGGNVVLLCHTVFLTIMVIL